MVVTVSAALDLLLSQRQEIQDTLGETFKVLSTAPGNDMENEQDMKMAKAELIRSLWIHLKSSETGYHPHFLAVHKRCLESLSSMYSAKLNQWRMSRYLCSCQDFLEHKVSELQRKTRELEHIMSSNGGISRLPGSAVPGQDCFLPGLVDNDSDSEVSTVDSLPNATFSVTFRGTCHLGHEMTVEYGLHHNDTIDIARVRGHCICCGCQAPLRNVSQLDWDARVVTWKFNYCSDACDHYTKVSSNEFASPFRFATVLPDKLVPPSRQGRQHSHRQPRKPVFEFGKLTFTATPSN